MSRVPHSALALAAALAIAVIAPVAIATATAAAGSGVIGPNQAFIGRVNGKHDHAKIEVLCPGPANTGHPTPGQTLVVHGGVDDLPGFTGSRAHEIVATLPTASSALSVAFSRYDTPAPIPTSLVLPCAGTAKVIFSPVPTSHTAIPDTVIVTFENRGVAR